MTLIGMKWLAGLHRRGPAGLFGMIGCVVLVEFFVAAHSMSFYDVDEWAYRWTARRADHGLRDCDVLCFGDSLTKLSIIPKIVQDQTNRPVFNLAVSGGQAPASYFLLRRALDAGAKPSAVLIDFNPPLLRAGPRHNLNRWPAFLNPIETWQLARWAGDSELLGAISIAQVFPSIRGKATIRAYIMDVLAGRTVPNFAWNSLGIRNWKSNRGAQLMTGSSKAHGLTDADVTALRTGYYPAWSCHPANIEGIDRFLALAHEANIRVYWMLPPLLPALQDQLAQSGIAAQHDEFVRSWQARYPNVVVLDARRKISDLNAFWDPQHLSVEGAAAFSRVIGRAIADFATVQPCGVKTASAEARWVTLPEFQLGPMPRGVEDFDESEQVVLRALKIIK